MLLKKLLCIAMAAVMLVSVTGFTGADGAADEISAEDITVTWDDSRVYSDLSLGRYKTITTYGVNGYEDVPFILASDYLNILCEGKEKISVEDGVMTILFNETEAVIDSAADTIFIENPAGFRSMGAVSGAVMDAGEYNVVTASLKNESTQENAAPMTISLKEYHMPAVAYENDILMPFLALQNTFGGICFANELAYNGKDYFNVFEAYTYSMDTEHAAAADSPYMKAIYSGPFSQKTAPTEAYAEYGYYAMCLLLDLTFGHKEEKNITTFDEYFTRVNAKNALTSTSLPATITTQFILFNYLFDSGHDAFASTRSVFGTIETSEEDVSAAADSLKDSQEGQELFDNPEDDKDAVAQLAADAVIGALLEKGLKIPAVAPLYIWSGYLEKTRPEDYGDERLDYAGNTAVIYFNSFKDNTEERDPSYYLEPISEEDIPDSTFAFFYNCFEDIQKHEEIENVVINLADNGGGSAAALVSVLGFLSEDGEVRFPDMDMLGNSYREEYYHVDTNLDGIADDNDGFGGQYDFYILCSGSSYSCSNALPYIAQQEGLASIIGTHPGGGDCVVASFIDAYGLCGFYSGSLKIGIKKDGTFVSDEKATTVDFDMMPSILDYSSVPWFDPEGIAEAVRLYEEGAVSMTYDPAEEAQKLTELLSTILQRQQQQQPEGN